MNEKIKELDFMYYIKLIQLEMKYQKMSQKDLSDKLGSYDFSIDIVKKFFSNHINNPKRQSQFISLCLQQLEISIPTMNEMIRKYKEVEDIQKASICVPKIYELKIRPILLINKSLEKYSSECYKNLKQNMRAEQNTLEMSYNADAYFRILGLPVEGLQIKVDNNLSREDYYHLFRQYLRFSDKIKNFWTIYWSDPNDEYSVCSAENKITEIQQILKQARPRLSSIAISSDFDTLYNIHHNSYAKKLDYYIDPKNINIIVSQINVPEFTKMFIDKTISKSFTVQWIILMQRLRTGRIDEYQSAWSIYYYLLNEKTLAYGKTNKEKKKARERKEVFFKTAYAYSFYLNSKK